jgi:hypothetical protein
MTFISALSLRVLVWSPTLIGLDLQLTPLISTTEKRELLTCTPDTTRAKFDRLRSARHIHHDQKITTRYAKALTKLMNS